jgi:hypothetical protein
MHRIFTGIVVLALAAGCGGGTKDVEEPGAAPPAEEEGMDDRHMLLAEAVEVLAMVLDTGDKMCTDGDQEVCEMLVVLEESTAACVGGVEEGCGLMVDIVFGLTEGQNLSEYQRCTLAACAGPCAVMVDSIQDDQEYVAALLDCQVECGTVCE